MNFLLDHDVPDDVIYSLVALGHTVLKLRDIVPVTTSDAEVLRTATERNCVLITCNRDDFLALARNSPHAGIVILVRRRSRALDPTLTLPSNTSLGEPHGTRLWAILPKSVCI